MNLKFIFILEMTSITQHVFIKFINYIISLSKYVLIELFKKINNMF